MPSTQSRSAIRSAHVTDAAEIARLAIELGYPCDAEMMRARLQELCGPRHWVGVAFSGTPALAGWVHVARCITLETGEYAEILGLIVDAGSRRAGVARALVAAAEHWGRELGLARMSVRSNTARVESHALYAALGYTRLKSQHVYVKAL